MRRRLDTQLVRLRLARSREHAQELISAGQVRVAGIIATKPATQVADGTAVVVAESSTGDYVSRGSHKLLGALAAFGPAGLTVAGRRALDAGASTGGFTQVLLGHGVVTVVAVDVGYGQLAWELQTDARVMVRDRTNVRGLQPADLPYAPDLIVADLSFISLRLVLPALTTIAAPGADMLLMVKPQFEVGRSALGSGGVVREPQLRAGAVMAVAAAAWELGWGLCGVTASPLPGPAGNVEYFIWLREDASAPDAERVSQAVQEGPQ